MKDFAFIVSPSSGIEVYKISKREALRNVNIWRCKKPTAHAQGKLKKEQKSGRSICKYACPLTAKAKTWFACRVTGRGKSFLQG